MSGDDEQRGRSRDDSDSRHTIDDTADTSGETATESLDDAFTFRESEVGPSEDDDQSAVGGNVFGSMSSDTEVIEPGTPSRENILFVLLGIFLGLLVFAQFYLLVAGVP